MVPQEIKIISMSKSYTGNKTLPVTTAMRLTGRPPSTTTSHYMNQTRTENRPRFKKRRQADSTPKPPSPKKPRQSIKRDRVDARDYVKYTGAFACEDCSHFSHEKEICTIGYGTAPHRRKAQQESYERTGTIAFCRFHEAD